MIAPTYIIFQYLIRKVGIVYTYTYIIRKYPFIIIFTSCNFPCNYIRDFTEILKLIKVFESPYMPLVISKNFVKDRVKVLEHSGMYRNDQDTR